MTVADQIYRRLCGDVLSLRFSENGSLSSSILKVDGRREDVTNQLYGLRIENSESYLRDLGFHKTISEAIKVLYEEHKGDAASHGRLIEEIYLDPILGHLRFRLVDMSENRSLFGKGSLDVRLG